MRLLKNITFVIGVIIAVIIVIVVLIIIKTIVEYVLYQIGLPNIGRPFHIDDVYSIMGG